MGNNIEFQPPLCKGRWVAVRQLGGIVITTKFLLHGRAGASHELKIISNTVGRGLAPAVRLSLIYHKFTAKMTLKSTHDP